MPQSESGCCAVSHGKCAAGHDVSVFPGERRKAGAQCAQAVPRLPVRFFLTEGPLLLEYFFPSVSLKGAMVMLWFVFPTAEGRSSNFKA